MPVELVTQVAIWFIVTYLLLLTSFQKHWQRVRFTLIIGLLVGLTFFLPLWNWWGFSAEYVIIRWANMMLGWFLAALAVSYFLRNKIKQIKS